MFDKRDFPAAAPALQFLLAYDRVVHVAKVLNPNEAVQMIAFREALYFSLPVLVQTTQDVIRDPDIQCSAAFVGENVHPIVVLAHANRNNQRCLKAWPHASHFVAALGST